MRLSEITQELAEMAGPTGTTPTTGATPSAPPSVAGSNGPGKGEQLTVQKQDKKQTTLVNKKTGIQTVIPNDPQSAGKIQRSPTGQAMLYQKAQGSVPQVKVGDQVTVA